ncbi:MAG: ribonucleoside-diphosphate reductase, adenosylcobalamin-dependent [Nitrospirae bacterium RIFCSPLOWO2_02_42_7]|nr:MAG: ribonucleoside-diphosphate reductase, adenosylcobalamin-dependent [Nitrospirae bacterium RIFCSPLOWO2_02_42_7]
MDVPRLSKNALKVLEKRYLRKDQEGRIIESPTDMFHRVASNISRADLKYKEKKILLKTEAIFHGMLERLEFLPNSPTLMNAGKKLGQLAACFVIPIEDSLDSIFEAVKITAMIHQTGGGTGFSFSKLRPKDDPVSSTGGIASGPVSFMKVFNTGTEVIKQGGTRRGANMGILRVDHPDILEFIWVKDNPEELVNFNISVAITDNFMKALDKDSTYPLINPRTEKTVKQLRARDVFKEITRAAWKNGDPGVIFINRINEQNPTRKIGEIEATNPCGEQPLHPYEACNLGSVNLTKMLKKIKRRYALDYDKLSRTVSEGIHFLDNVIDVNHYPIPQIESITKANRRIGLGVMGFTDMLIMLGIPYNSEDAIKTAEEIMSFIQSVSKETSMKLAKERGAFPNFKKSVYYERRMPPLRNATTTTIAPTGTLSIIAGCSGGIEPLYGVSFVREVLDGDKLYEVNPFFKQMAFKIGIYNDRLVSAISDSPSIQNIPSIPKDMKELFVTAFDIPPVWHVKMQAVFQKYVDNAVSKTINLPYNATIQDIEDAYIAAYKLGCKGVTVFRTGSRKKQVLSCANVLYC